MTLTEFLEARIAEDEAAANEANWAMQGKWYVDADDKVDEYVRLISPARVLAECEAKRRIMAAGQQAAEAHGHYFSAFDDALHLLALPYADHPDYPKP